MKKNLLLFSALLCINFAQAFNVTFIVDMNTASGFTIPEVNGTFNSWCGSCNPLTDANNDSIWESTISLPAGIIEYKFSFNNWQKQETLTPGSSCTVTNSGFTNRVLTFSSVGQSSRINLSDGSTLDYPRNTPISIW